VKVIQDPASNFGTAFKSGMMPRVITPSIIADPAEMQDIDKEFVTGSSRSQTELGLVCPLAQPQIVE
jgi:hypothetical protein